MTRSRNPDGPASQPEAAVVLPVFFIMVFDVDLSTRCCGTSCFRSVPMPVLPWFTVSAGRYGSTAWGTTTINVFANVSGYPIVDQLAPLLVGFDLSKTKIKVEWPQGSNDVQVDNTVRVTITAPYKPIMASMFGTAVLNLSASSTVPIAF